MRCIHGLVGAFLFVLAPAAAGCSSGTNCDCGCKIAPSDQIHVIGGGIDGMGVAAIDLDLFKKGKCGGEDADAYWLRWEMGVERCGVRT